MYRLHHLTVLAAILTALLAVGCNSGGHKMAADQDGKSIACSKCYDEAVRLRARSWKGGPDRVISRHQCADCGTEVTTYVEDGKAMIKCSNCAPDGVACDLCVPASHGGS